MSTLAGTAVTLDDLIKQTAPDGSIERKIIDRLSRMNQLLQYLPFKETNKETGEQYTQTTALASVSYAILNSGTAKSKGRNQQCMDAVAKIEGVQDVDARLLEINGWKPGYLANEALKFTEAMNQQLATDLIYADHGITPEKFDGTFTRLDTPSTTRGTYGYQMISGGGSGSDNTSILFATLGEDLMTGLYGKGTKAGLRKAWEGEQWVDDASSNPYLVHRTKWEWNVGLAVKDPQAIVRICNIDKSALVADTSAADLDELMIRSIHLNAKKNMGPSVFLVNRTVHAWLDIQTFNSSQRDWTKTEDAFGNPINKFRGYPVLMHEAITNAEATVTGTFQSDI